MLSSPIWAMRVRHWVTSLGRPPRTPLRPRPPAGHTAGTRRSRSRPRSSRCSRSSVSPSTGFRSSTISSSATSAGRGSRSRPGNALSKLIIGPLFGVFAGIVVDRFGPKRLMLAGIVMAGLALVGLGGTLTLGAFYAFYFLNALGNVCGGRCRARSSSRAGSRAPAGRRWAPRTSVSASAARSSPSWPTPSSRRSAGDRAPGPRRADDRHRAAHRPPRQGPRPASPPRRRGLAGRELDPRRRSARVLPARARQHGLDRGRRRHDAEPEAVPRHGPQARPGPRGRGALARPRRQPRRPCRHGLAGRSVARRSASCCSST